MVQIIASDMDGTLLNDKMVISKRNAAAVKEAQKQGIHFIVSTGRAYDQRCSDPRLHCQKDHVDFEEKWALL